MADEQPNNNGNKQQNSNRGRGRGRRHGGRGGPGGGGRGGPRPPHPGIYHDDGDRRGVHDMIDVVEERGSRPDPAAIEELPRPSQPQGQQPSDGNAPAADQSGLEGRHESG